MEFVRLRQVARRQLGVFSRSQARECGVTARQVRSRLAAGEWRPVVGSVLAHADVRLTPLVLDRAAPLAIAGGVIAGPSAARTWGIEVPDERIYLAVGRDHHPSLRSVRFLRTEIDRHEICLWEGAPVTTRRRTIADCLRLLPERAATDLLDRALQRGWISMADLTDYVRRWVGQRNASTPEPPAWRQRGQPLRRRATNLQAPDQCLHQGLAFEHPDRRRTRVNRRGRLRLRG